MLQALKRAKEHRLSRNELIILDRYEKTLSKFPKRYHPGDETEFAKTLKKLQDDITIRQAQFTHKEARGALSFLLDIKQLNLSKFLDDHIATISEPEPNLQDSTETIENKIDNAITDTKNSEALGSKMIEQCLGILNATKEYCLPSKNLNHATEAQFILTSYSLDHAQELEDKTTALQDLAEDIEVVKNKITRNEFPEDVNLLELCVKTIALLDSDRNDKDDIYKELMKIIDDNLDYVKNENVYSFIKDTIKFKLYTQFILDDITNAVQIKDINTVDILKTLLDLKEDKTLTPALLYNSLIMLQEQAKQHNLPYVDKLIDTHLNSTTMSAITADVKEPERKWKAATIKIKNNGESTASNSAKSTKTINTSSSSVGIFSGRHKKVVVRKKKESVCDTQKNPKSIKGH